jgi:hypothetical protein
MAHRIGRPFSDLLAVIEHDDLVGQAVTTKGLSAMILSMSAEVNAPTCGFSRRACGGRET